jgi:hypothetical protein
MTPADVAVASNVWQAVPFFNVTDIDASLRFYVDGLGCVVTHQWLQRGVFGGAGCNSAMPH